MLKQTNATKTTQNPKSAQQPIIPRQNKTHQIKQPTNQFKTKAKNKSKPKSNPTKITETGNTKQTKNNTQK